MVNTDHLLKELHGLGKSAPFSDRVFGNGTSVNFGETYSQNIAASLKVIGFCGVCKGHGQPFEFVPTAAQAMNGLLAPAGVPGLRIRTVAVVPVLPEMGIIGPLQAFLICLSAERLQTHQRIGVGPNPVKLFQRLRT
eukprot:3503413-Amphidinium_carterae.1